MRRTERHPSDDAWGVKPEQPGERQWIEDMTAGMDDTRVSLFVPESPSRLVEVERDQALIDATSADNECRHGNLPADGEECGCWT